ncbi:MAG: hypothetical protein HY016_11580 [Nitrosomonadales bacterium]|nr:hypothetical protein [Nitrosomonadales bacterium]
MLKKILWLSSLAGILALTAVLAAVQERERDQTQALMQERIYVSQLMTQQERLDHRAKMHAAKTATERELIRNDLYEHMRARAKERGLPFYDEPSVIGGRMQEPIRGMGS